ncbi:MAG TPA: hypothetical protein VGF45_15405 [Polyangia bacterium]
MRGALLLLVIVSACANSASFHPGPTRLNGREQRALLAAKAGRPGGFERFWLRTNCQIGLVKWRADRSQAVKAAPAGLLDLIRDEVGRVNRKAAEGETVFVEITVFEWNRRWFGRPPRFGYEVVGRDRAGQILWLAEDRLVVPRDRAVTAADADELIAAREVGRKLLMELGR